MQTPCFSTSKKTPLQILDNVFTSPIKINPPSNFLSKGFFVFSKILSHFGLDFK